MADDVNNTQVVNEDENIQDLNSEYIYLTIPSEYICVYHKLLTYMADFGKTIVDDCTASCKGNGKNILTCWNLFQSAIACKALGRIKEADFFMEYISKQLDITYKGTESDVFTTIPAEEVSSDGKLKSILTCGNNTRFYVDLETGVLKQEYIK